MANTIDFYHYTNKNALDAILNTMELRPSLDTVLDAVHGPGVYGTTMSPSKYSADKIARNNFDDVNLWETRLSEGKVDYAIKICIPKNEVKVVNDSQGRDILLYEAGAIDLNKYGYEVIKVKGLS